MAERSKTMKGRTVGHIGTKVRACRLGYCEKHTSAYAGGNEEVVRKLTEGVCPICGGNLDEPYRPSCALYSPLHRAGLWTRTTK